MKKIGLMGLFVGACFIGSLAQSASEDLRVRSVAVPFLRISPDARAAAMGDAGIATTPDAHSMFWNLAKTPFTKSKSGVSVTYTPWFKDLGLTDVYLASAGGYTKLGDGQSAIALGMRFFSLGTIQFKDFAGNDLQTFRPREMAFDFGYTRKLSDRFSLGVALKYINSSLANGTFSGVPFRAGNTVAGDISVYYDGTTEQNGGGFAWGVTLSNLGGKIGYTNDNLNKDFIPANLGFGFNYNYVIDEANKVSFTLDINKSLVPAPPLKTGIDSVDIANYADYRKQSVLGSWGTSFSDGGGFMKSLTFSLGAEYNYGDQFFARAGYFHEDATEGNRKYFAVGTGVKFNTMGINFSYLVPSGQGVTRNPLSNTLRFGLTFDLDPEDNK